MKNNLLLLFFFLLSIMLSACFPQLRSPAADSSSHTVPESGNCLTNFSYTSTVTINGTAQFYRRGLTVTQSSAQVTRLILGAQVPTALPIRFAEIQVFNSAGQIVQCGKTDSSGSLKALDGVSYLTIPSTAGLYTVKVFSRTNQNMNVSNSKPIFKSNFSVKEDIYSNNVYSISTSIDSSGSGSYVANLIAEARESQSAKVEGGAFNIYNDLISAYDYFSQLPDSATDFTCLNSKLSVYWKAGFNPAKYLYPNSNEGDLGTLSFYLRGQSELYINGGVLGNLSTVDTDHFDDAVIIHELGHYMEDVCGAMDSPGGQHSGQHRMDPRLVWSEAWGNFIGAHIIRNRTSNISPVSSGGLPNNEWLFYFDSEGYTDPLTPGSAGFEYIRINLARPGSNANESVYTSSGISTVTYDAVNSTNYPGESHFREVSIARGLFKGTNSCSAPFANCVNTSFFADYWKAFEGRAAGAGMGKSIYPFRSSVRFIDRLKSAQGGILATSLNNLFTTDEALHPAGSSAFTVGGYTTWVPYGVKLVPNGSTACPLKIQPVSNLFASNGKSDQRYSNHFYLIDPSVLSSVGTLNMTANFVNNAGTTNGLTVDLLVYPEGYSFGEDTSMTRSTVGAVQSSRGNFYPKTISISNLGSSARYILNVRVYTPSNVVLGTEYTYTLTDQSGGFLCPASSF